MINKILNLGLLFLLLSLSNCEKVLSKYESTPSIKSFSYSPQVLILDSISGKLFDIDSVQIDSLTMTVVFSSSDSFEVILNNSNLGYSKYSDTVDIKIPLTSLFTTNIVLGEYDFPTCFITSEMDTVGKDTVSIIVHNEYVEPYYRYCWHLDNYDLEFHNQYNIDTASNIHIQEAWEISRGAGVIVAVIDDSFEKIHEDLAASIYGTYNVNTESDDVAVDLTSPSHGSTCAGFIAAPANGIGVVGVAPEAKLLLISETTYFDYNTLKAFDYAKEKGAKVISCSWGSYDVSQALTSKLKEMYDAGITVLFANGNDGYDLDNEAWDDESEVPWVLGIGASGEDNDYTSYTNYGSNIEVIAPGGDDLGVLSIDNMGENGWTYQYGLVNNNYVFITGTSFATPVTAGVVALMLGANAGLTPDGIRTILIETADKIGGSNANYVNGFDKYRAYGKVNAAKAVKRAAGL